MSGGLGARVQGLKRYYALELTRNNKVRLIKMLDELLILKETHFNFEFNKEYELSLQIKGNLLVGSVDNKQVLSFNDQLSPLTAGGISLIVESGTLFTNNVDVFEKYGRNKLLSFYLVALLQAHVNPLQILSLIHI